MAVSLGIYSNGNTATKTLQVDFVADYLASSSNGVSENTKYFFRFNTQARNTDNGTMPTLVSESLSDLVLNKEKRSMSNSAAHYGNVKSMIVDYTYDYIHGHESNQFLSGSREQKPMSFSH